MLQSQPSYVAGTSTEPLMYKTIGQVLDEAVASYGESLALVCCHQNVRWTYNELAAKVNAFSQGLLDLGLVKGDRIGIWSPNRWEWVVAQLATAKLGLILVNINPSYRLSELEYVLNKVECCALIIADRFKTSNYVEMLRSLAPEIDASVPGELSSEKLPALKLIIVIGEKTPIGFLNFDSIVKKGEMESPDRLKLVMVGMQPDDAINIQFTSGTTGQSKGATLSHHNILNNAYFVAQRQNICCNDRLCIPVPLYHCFGMVMGVLACITNGAAMIFPGEAFEAESVLQAIETERCTALYGVPTMFIAELEHPNFSQFDLSSLRTGIMAGSLCPIDVMRRVMQDMHMSEVTICYGMTETSPVSFQSLTDDPVDKRVTTVGRVHPFVEVKIIDKNSLTVPRGEQGELLTRGYSVMRGYWQDAEKTSDAIDNNGWMHTGDLATMDNEGYVSITGRLKDMIIRGGENIYPREIEEYLFQHPKIQDVQVFGVADQKFGEAVCAWIKLKEHQCVSEEEIKEYCSGQIAHYKIPRYIRFVDEFPMTVTGKIQKFVMRDIMNQQFEEERRLEESFDG